MHQDFWLERWQQNQIGFHADEVNPHLLALWPRLNIPLGATVFVPLCGKSKDMLWLLAQGYQVLGIELSPLAVQAFFAEHQLSATTHQQGNFTVSAIDGLQIFCGDFFDLQPEDLKNVSAVYDRAALVALPPDMRTAYAEKLRQLLAPATTLLLLAFAYAQQDMPGPPFSVDEPEVLRLYQSWCDLEQLASEDILEREFRFRERGLTGLLEQVYRLSVL
jgi:thiopurine S-methyltransferase